MYGKLVDQNHVLFDGVALPQGVGAGSDPDTLSTAIHVDAPGTLYLKAKSAIAVNTAKKFYIELLTGTTALNCAAPTNAHQFVYYKDSADGPVSIAEGADIGQPIKIGWDLVDKYIQLKMYTDEDLSAQEIDAFLHVNE